jgi:adenylate cyclase
MFADISNFTQMTEKMVPTQMVGMLNKVFSWFDAMTDKHGLEKIKTIGDAYMVVGGLIRNRDDYVKNIVDMALEIRDLISTHPELARHNIGIHIGIATGPAVAGVLGSKRFIYDVWGDAVNVASRLADEGKQGEILTDKVTYNRLRNQYTFSPPIMVELKGKGELTVYSLKGRSNSSSER